ncbi:alpha/beta fold hydrolase [Nocardia alba]|uniref:Pimeloyl-ACP methyl ester carboxylesterase n=1 Tax=Nocardia alba TaxID=225051 RepID=A0A4R1G0D2_9NOCA|nr:alpha/beta hydrolase [Nocardia alba]TCJ99549.1 pimeloyl-ACP methyl ester carboxylesterase [Nocardia alba]
MPFVHSDAVNVHFRTDAADGPTLLLAHGFLMDESMFDPIRKVLAHTDINVVAWDARGHGRTGYGADPRFDYWDLATDGLRVLDALGIEHAIVGGVSQGGYAALRMALLAPERVTGLALLDTDADACTRADETYYENFFDEWCGTGALRPLAEDLAPRLIGGADTRIWHTWINRWLARDRTAIRPAAECLIGRDSIHGRLGEITVPALVLRGEHDHSSTVDKSTRVADGLPGARAVRTVAGAGHGCALTHPEQVGAALAALVTACTPYAVEPVTVVGI